MHDRTLPIAYMVSAGNSAALGMHDYIDAFLADDRVSVIALHIEGLNDVHAFSEAALRALNKGVPIIAMKTGTSALGAQATMSHTSSLAGADELYDSLFKRLGIARCYSIHEFIETAKFLAYGGALKDNTLASMSCSGGEASMIADRAEPLGLVMPPLSSTATTKLHAVLGDKVHINNPLDYHTYIWSDQDALQNTFTAVLEDANACNVLVLDYPRPDVCGTEAWEVTEAALIAAKNTTNARTVMVSTIAENFLPDARTRVAAEGIAPMQGLNECLHAIHCAATIGAAQASAADRVAVSGPTSSAQNPVALDEWNSKKQLVAYGLPVPKGSISGIDEIGDAADALGYPLCLKVLSTEIAHKTDVGGVQTGLTSRNEVEAAAQHMRGLSSDFLLEEMAPQPVLQLIVGVKSDPQFGHALVIGAGGVLVELVRDSAALLLPTNREEIGQALDGLAVSKLMAGYRGAPAGDREATIDAIVAIASFAADHAGRLVELDVNPLFVLPKGVVAVDAFIRLAP